MVAHVGSANLCLFAHVAQKPEVCLAGYGLTLGAQPAMAIPAEAATELLAQARPLEPATATRTHTVDQDGDLTAGKPHLTRPASTLTANGDQATSGDPGADGSGAHPEVFDDLRHSDQDTIGSRVHGPTLSQRERNRQALFAISRRIKRIKSTIRNHRKPRFHWHLCVFLSVRLNYYCRVATQREANHNL